MLPTVRFSSATTVEFIAAVNKLVSVDSSACAEALEDIPAATINIADATALSLRTKRPLSSTREPAGLGWVRDYETAEEQLEMRRSALPGGLDHTGVVIQIGSCVTLTAMTLLGASYSSPMAPGARSTP